MIRVPERVNEYADVRLHAKLAISDANRSQVDHFGALSAAVFRTLFSLRYIYSFEIHLFNIIDLLNKYVHISNELCM